MQSIELSIIIVNYKSWGVLSECLMSINKYKPTIYFEVIVVDNDSQDGQFNLFKEKFQEVVFIKNSGNNGYSNGSNLGANYASGKYLLFLNPDTVFTISTAIESIVSFANQHDDIGLVSCRKIKPGGKIEREMTFLNPLLTIGWLRALYKLIFKRRLSKQYPNDADVWYTEWVTGSIVLTSAELFKSVGQMSEKLYWMYFEEPDLARKVIAKGKKIALLRNLQINHIHGGSSRRNPKTTSITKSEVVTSGHVYIQTHESGLFRVIAHTAMLLNALISQLLRVLITLPFFWKTIFKSNILVLFATIKYYVYVPLRGTWKSKRLITNEKNNQTV